MAFNGVLRSVFCSVVLLGLFLSVRQTTPSTCFPDRLTLFENTTPVVFTSRIELNETIMFMECGLDYTPLLRPQLQNLFEWNMSREYDIVFITVINVISLIEDTQMVTIALFQPHLLFEFDARNELNMSRQISETKLTALRSSLICLFHVTTYFASLLWIKKFSLPLESICVGQCDRHSDFHHRHKFHNRFKTIFMNVVFSILSELLVRTVSYFNSICVVNLCECNKLGMVLFLVLAVGACSLFIGIYSYRVVMKNINLLMAVVIPIIHLLSSIRVLNLCNNLVVMFFLGGVGSLFILDKVAVFIMVFWSHKRHTRIKELIGWSVDMLALLTYFAVLFYEISTFDGLMDTHGQHTNVFWMGMLMFMILKVTFTHYVYKYLKRHCTIVDNRVQLEHNRGPKVVVIIPEMTGEQIAEEEKLLMHKKIRCNLLVTNRSTILSVGDGIRTTQCKNMDEAATDKPENLKKKILISHTGPLYNKIKQELENHCNCFPQFHHSGVIFCVLTRKIAKKMSALQFSHLGGLSLAYLLSSYPGPRPWSRVELS